MAGCTDLYVALNLGTLPPARFLDLWRLDELRRIEARDGVLSIGALVTYADLLRSPLVSRRLPMLTAAAREVGGAQIRNRGTLGGNVAHGSPAGGHAARAGGGRRQRRPAERRRRAPCAPDPLLPRAAPDRAAPGRAGRGDRGAARPGTAVVPEGRGRAAQTIAKVVMAAVRGPRPGASRWAAWPPRSSACPRRSQPSPRARRWRRRSSASSRRSRRSTTCAPPRTTRRRVAANLFARFWADTAP